MGGVGPISRKKLSAYYVFDERGTNSNDRRKYDDDDVSVAMLKACRLPSSVSNLLHWEIALFPRRP